MTVDFFTSRYDLPGRVYFVGIVDGDRVEFVLFSEKHMAWKGTDHTKNTYTILPPFLLKFLETLRDNSKPTIFSIPKSPLTQKSLPQVLSSSRCQEDLLERTPLSLALLGK